VELPLPLDPVLDGPQERLDGLAAGASALRVLDFRVVFRLDVVAIRGCEEANRGLQAAEPAAMGPGLAPAPRQR